MKWSGNLEDGTLECVETPEENTISGLEPIMEILVKAYEEARKSPENARSAFIIMHNCADAIEIFTEKYYHVF
jgi:hypothetical protein